MLLGNQHGLYTILVLNCSWLLAKKGNAEGGGEEVGQACYTVICYDIMQSRSIAFSVGKGCLVLSMHPECPAECPISIAREPCFLSLLVYSLTFCMLLLAGASMVTCNCDQVDYIEMVV